MKRSKPGHQIPHKGLVILHQAVFRAGGGVATVVVVTVDEISEIVRGWGLSWVIMTDAWGGIII